MNNSQVLILRAAEQATDLLERCSHFGLAGIAHSFVAIEPLVVPAQQTRDLATSRWHGAIVVSKNAAVFADRCFADLNLDWPVTRWFTVGPASGRTTANLARQAVTCPLQQHASEQLLSLAELNHVKQQRWLIIRGVGGRELIASTLRARGADVIQWDVYKRLGRPQLDASTLHLWQQQIGVIVATSAEQLSNFLAALRQLTMANVGQDQVQQWLSGCKWVVSSTRLAALLPAVVQPKQVYVTDSAIDFALANQLQQLTNN